MTVSLTKNNIPLPKNQRPVKGDKIVFTDRYGAVIGTNNKPGDVVEVVKTEDRGGLTDGYVVYIKAALRDDRGPYGFEWFNLLPDEPVAPPACTLVLDKDTSREYAFRARSAKCLNDEHNGILLRASRGEEVDAYEFRKAVTAALSLAATRAGQSMARRTWTKEARHLLYIADAVIDNHRLGLQPLEPGTKSPTIKRLRAQVSELEGEVTKLQVEGSPEVKAVLDDARLTIDDLRATNQRLATVIGDQNVAANEEIARLLAIVNGNAEALQRLNEEKAKTEAERDHWASVVLYVGLRFPETAETALAYSDGLDDA